jgi:hypothetical protein
MDVDIEFDLTGVDHVGLVEGQDVGFAVAHGERLAILLAEQDESPGELGALDERVGGVVADRSALDEFGHREETVDGGCGGGHGRDRPGDAALAVVTF